MTTNLQSSVHMQRSMGAMGSLGLYSCSHDVEVHILIVLCIIFYSGFVAERVNLRWFLTFGMLSM